MVCLGVKADILQIAGFQEGCLPFKYLRIPITADRMTRVQCQVLIEKFTARITSFGTRHLSYSGRLVLINSVLTSLYSYWMTIFIIPKGVLSRLNSMCRNFLWDGTIDHIRAPPVSWEKICSPKNEGGLGIRDSFVWNTAAIGKLVWWVYFNPDKLWVKWVSQIYLKGQAWPDYQPSGDLSWGWKSVFRVRDKMSQGYVQGQWVLDTKGYTLKSGYELLRVKFQPVVWHKAIWNLWCVPKHRFICWMMVRNVMQVKSKLFHLGISPDDLCLLCGGATETHVHLFEQCVYSRSVLQGMATLCQINIPSVNILQWVWNQKWAKARKGIVLCAFMACYYHIWMMRNRARMELHLPRPAVALHQAKCSAKMRINVLSSQLDLCTRSWLESIDLCK
ncbi:uncharacterized protein LOC141651440 [Silene latifolia]|uniref:uncharacterized protein LOC141651440 n=1 Tax=Silene latifolia TaxID=37657 RepID=UPI003D78ADD3